MSTWPHRRSSIAPVVRFCVPLSSPQVSASIASEAGLYLWATEDRDAWESLGRLADLGILVGPGHFYGDHFPNHIRFSLTASDERIGAAADRLLDA